jgi:hypothetical protein
VELQNQTIDAKNWNGTEPPLPFEQRSTTEDQQETNIPLRYPWACLSSPPVLVRRSRTSEESTLTRAATTPLSGLIKVHGGIVRSQYCAIHLDTHIADGPQRALKNSSIGETVACGLACGKVAVRACASCKRFGRSNCSLVPLSMETALDLLCKRRLQ